MPHRTTRPAPANTAHATPGCPYLTIAAVCPILRQGVPAGLLVLLRDVPAPMPPARGRVVELGPESVLEVA